MSSIFDLKTSASQLPSINQGAAKMDYQQISSSVPVDQKSFPNSQKKYRFDLSGGNTWWIPNRSYMEMRVSLYRQAGTDQLTLADNIAINMNAANNMFQQAEFLIANKVVSKLEDNVPQISMLQTRLTKSKVWMDSIGNSTNFLQPDFSSRQEAVVSDNLPSITDLDDTTLYTRNLLQGFPGSGTTGETTLGWTNIGAAEFKNGFNNTDTWLRVGDVLYFPNSSTSPAARNLALQVLTVANDGTFTVMPLNYVPMLTQADAKLNAGALSVSQSLLYRPVVQVQGKTSFELIWQPALSIFNIPNALPCGQYELRLTPATTDIYQKALIESILASKVPGTDFNIQVTDMYLYICTIESNRIDNITYYLSLDEINAQPVALDTNNANTTIKKQFDVSPSTYALTVAFQSANIINDTRYSASKFKFVSGACSDTSLSSLYLQFNSQSRPSPYASPIYDSKIDYITQRYLDNQLYNGSFFDNAGSESKEDWIARGTYHYFSFPKDGASESTRAYVNFAFDQAITSGDATLFLFSHYKKTVAVSIVEGRITSVIEQDA